MKTTIKTAVAAVTAILVSMSLYAQQPGSKRISREELAVKQAEHICTELALDSATSTKFKETYCAFQKEIWALGPSLGRKSSEDPDKAEIEQRFERTQKILDIRKKYYGIYSTFLTQKQITRVYEIEREMMRRLSMQKAQSPKSTSAKTTNRYVKR